GHAIDETGARREKIERADVLLSDAELFLQHAGGGWEWIIWRDGTDDDQVEVAGFDAGGVNGGLRRLDAHITGGFFGRGDAAGFDSRPRRDPLIACVQSAG